MSSPVLVAVALLGLVAAGASQADGQAVSLAPSDQKPRDILNAAIQALGGKAFLGAKDMRAEGRAFQFGRDEELQGLARFTEYEKFPDKLRQELGKDKEVVVVINGDKGWDKTFRGVREYPEEEMLRIRENRLLSVENVLRFRLNEPGVTLRYAGTDLIGNRLADLVEVEDADNRLVTIAVDQSDKLPVRRQWSRRNPKTRLLEKEVELLGNYRKLGDIQTPFYSMRERDGQKIFEVFLTTAAYNQNLPDSLFQRPPGPDRPEPGRKKR